MYVSGSCLSHDAGHCTFWTVLTAEYSAETQLACGAFLLQLLRIAAGRTTGGFESSLQEQPATVFTSEL